MGWDCPHGQQRPEAGLNWGRGGQAPTPSGPRSDPEQESGHLYSRPSLCFLLCDLGLGASLLCASCPRRVPHGHSPGRRLCRRRDLTQSREVPLSPRESPTPQPLSSQALKVTSGEEAAQQPTVTSLLEEKPREVSANRKWGWCREVNSDSGKHRPLPALSPLILFCSVMGCCVCHLSPPPDGRSGRAATWSQLYPSAHAASPRKGHFNEWTNDPVHG